MSKKTRNKRKKMNIKNNKVQTKSVYNEWLRKKLIILWKFINENEIISAILIGLLVYIGKYIFSIYRFIYWFPYFWAYRIPLKYFDLLQINHYQSDVSIILSIILFVLVFISVFNIENKLEIISSEHWIRNCFLNIIYVCVIRVVKSIFRNLRVFPSFIRYGLFNNIITSLLIIIFLLIVTNKFRNSRIKVGPLLIIVVVITCIGASFLWFGISGFNDVVVPSVETNHRIIDENKLILFDTDSQYYVIECEIIKNPEYYAYDNLKINRQKYEFIDRDGTQVVKDHLYRLVNEREDDIGDDIINRFLVKTRLAFGVKWDLYSDEDLCYDVALYD